MFIRFITTGGTIDKIYFDALSQFEIGDSLVKHILTEGLAEFDYEIVPLLQKDSLDMTDEDRATLRDYIVADDADRYVVTHGTDTMPETADALASRLTAPGLRLHEHVDPTAVRKLLDVPVRSLDREQGYALSMLLTLSAWLERGES